MEGFTCSFCGKGRREGASLISGPQVFICEECVGLCNDIIAERSTADSYTMAHVRRFVARVAPLEVSVLVRGARGVGKSFWARTIHRLSGRTGEFVTVSCDGPEHQLAVDLFGHDRTAKVGWLEATSGGTVLLESVDRLSLGAQAMLLRTLEQGAVLPVGGMSPRPTDVRVIASTDQDLLAACHNRTFRSDLYAHLSASILDIPLLRQRIDDVPRLAFEFLQDFRRESGRDASPKLTPEAMDRLRRYSWPGNVGELQVVIRRALLLCAGAEISTGDITVELPAPLAKPETTVAYVPPEDDSDPIEVTPGRECSLCGDSDSQVRMLFRGADAQICDQCVEEAQVATCSASRQPDQAAGPGAGPVVERTDVGCAFCKRSAPDVAHLVGAQDDQLICDGCLDGYDQFLGERFSADWPRGRTFTLRTVYPSMRIDDSTDAVRDELRRGRPCRIVVLVDDGEADPARLLLDRIKASLTDVADFWETNRQDPGVELTAIGLPRPAHHPSSGVGGARGQ